MMKVLRSCLVAFLVFAGPVVHACDLPKPVPVPDGASANERDMIAADLAVKRYVADVQSYVDCVESETRSLRSNALRRDRTGTKLREESAIKRLNEAAAAIEHVATLFNEAVAAYKEQRR